MVGVLVVWRAVFMAGVTLSTPAAASASGGVLVVCRVVWRVGGGGGGSRVRAVAGDKKGGGRWAAPPFVVVWRRCPTLPHPGGCSTIGAGSLSFRVRKGKVRACPCRYDRRHAVPGCHTPPRGGCGVRVSHSGRESPSPQRKKREEKCVGLVGPLVPVGFTPLRGVHVRSINPVVFGGPSHREGGGELVLKRASRLDAFSGYPSRT